MTATAPRMRFRDFEFERFPNSRCTAKVVLTYPDGEDVIGTAEGVGSEAAELRCSAEATLRALAGVIGDMATFELLGVKAIKAFDTTVIIIAVSVRADGEVQRLVGSYLASDYQERGAAVAVLNATNRFLGNAFFAR